MKPTPIEELVAQMFATGRALRDRAAARGGQGKFDPMSRLRVETLRYIKERGSPTMRDVATHLFVTPPSATSLVDSLVRSGHLSRVHDPADRRIVRLALTLKGERMLRAGTARIMTHMRTMLSKLDDNDRRQLVKILKKLAH